MVSPRASYSGESLIRFSVMSEHRSSETESLDGFPQQRLPHAGIEYDTITNASLQTPSESSLATVLTLDSVLQTA